MLVQECMKCSRPALIHITEVAAKGPPPKIHEIHLCLEHAIEAGLIGTPMLLGQSSSGKATGENTPLHSELAKLQQLDADAATDQTDLVSAIACTACGLTWSQFQKRGRMGCPHDYTVFEKQLTNLIRSMHERHSQHTGKIPPRSDAPDTLAQAKLIQLQAQLHSAIRAERFEEAARLRDQLRTNSSPKQAPG